MAKMTFEVMNAGAPDIVELKLAGYTIERLDRTCINVKCEDRDADALSDLLDNLQLAHRLV